MDPFQPTCLIVLSLKCFAFELVGSVPNEISFISKLSFLAIDDNNLTGVIPPSLGNITTMEVFSIVYNPLGGSIPDTLGRWKSLRELAFGDCYLNGTIPRSIFNLSLLTSFSVPGNQLTGSLPLEIGTMLPNLVVLQLRFNQLTGVLPPSISNCSRLYLFEIDRNNFSGKLTIDFSKLSDITDVHLSYNNLHGHEQVDDLKFINSLTNCSKLETLNLYNCNLHGVLPSSISNLSDQLTFLSLGKNQIYGNIPSSISNLISLTSLFLEANQLTGKIPDTIGMLQKLSYLELYENKLSGLIPDAIGNLSSMIILGLYSNSLEGNIPSSLGKFHMLSELYLNDNKLTGKIPKKLFQLPSVLSTLNLSQNQLSGSIPVEVGNLKMLNHLDLSYNNLSGSISNSLGGCVSLTTLSLRGNVFQGVIPPSLTSLRGLEVLDISQNHLIGRIPQFLERILFKFLNLSLNDFEGEVPVKGVFANASAFSVLGNIRLCGGSAELRLPRCKTIKKHKKRFFLVMVVVILIGSVVLSISCFVYVLCKKRTNNQPSQASKNHRFLQVSYNQLLKATDGFSEANLIGKGGFSSVYKGALDVFDDRFVAIKVLHLQNEGAQRSFMRECEAWRNIRHRYMLKILTSCSSVDFQGNDFKALVYEFMPKGSLHDCLHSSENTLRPNLLQRINILANVASVLDYLHNRCQTTIVHGDLKPSNILLDDDMVGHVGDFGLARFLGAHSNQRCSTGVKGTIGYAPPEYGLGNEMTSSGDVYSFGILLLEVMTGKMPTDDMFNDGLSLHKFAYMALPDHVVDVIDNDVIVLQNTEANAQKMEKCLASIVKIGVSCSMDSPSQRINNIENVVKELEHILDALQNI
ncbi:leucine-rich repeat protein [Tanacetum coccineum]